MIWNNTIYPLRPPAIYSVDSGQCRCINYNPASYYLTFIAEFQRLTFSWAPGSRCRWERYMTLADCSCVPHKQPIRIQCASLVTNQIQANWPEADQPGWGVGLALRLTQEHVQFLLLLVSGLLFCIVIGWRLVNEFNVVSAKFENWLTGAKRWCYSIQWGTFNLCMERMTRRIILCLKKGL